MSKVTVDQKLELLDGCEVMSLKHEGVVYIKNARTRQAFVNGREFQLTDKDVNYLYRRMVKEELGY
jgi:hypothetical protein